MKVFQNRHFLQTDITPTAALNTGSLESAGTQYEDVSEDDDGLGYYPHGVKRTLTDEQIAMFRHSEIYTLLRERQVREENREADLDLSSRSPILEEDAENQATNVRTGGAKNEMVDNDNSDDEEEYAKFLETEKRNAEATHTRKKREFNGGEINNYRGRPITHRRIARELDDIVASEQTLDYDEEPSKPTTVSDNIAMEDHIHQSDRAEHHPHEYEHSTEPEGRKIWWPTIGT